MLRRLLSPSKRTSLARYSFSKTRRTYTVKPRRPTPEEVNAAAVQHRLSNHAAFAFQTGWNFFKLAALAGGVLGLTVIASYELSHQYVESKRLGRADDEEVRKYQWDVSEDVWQGDASAGGTDPGLGRKGRQAVRAAWMAINWGVESPELQLTPITTAADAPTLYAIQYLQSALDVAHHLDPSSLHPLTIPALHNATANLYGRLGSAYAIYAKEHYEKAWAGFSGEGLRAARVALKLGDTNVRLQQGEEARKWWERAIQLCEGSTSGSLGPLLEPTQIPASPWAQRIIASTLVSLSAFYAQSGKLREAEKFEESALAYLRSIPTPDSIADTSHPQALHALFLLQRSSLISIHLAEVLNAQKKSVLTSIQYLALAATSSERVARALAGLPLHQTTKSLDDAPIPQGEDQISSKYTSSNHLSPVASRLYRDAKRACAEAWNLLGVLYEQHEGRSSKTALLCYERAIRWSGEGGEKAAANEGTTEADWAVFWANFQRVKESSK